MRTGDAMSTELLVLTPDQTLASAAAAMVERGVSAGVVVDRESGVPAIVTQRDLVRSLADGGHPSQERVERHLTGDVTFAANDWDLDRAAETMVRGGFRHLVVREGEQTAGLISMRDIVRHWLEQRTFPSRPIPIREVMTVDLLMVGAADTLRGAASLMAERGIGAAVVGGEEAGGRPGVVTEHSLLESVAGGADVDSETVGDHLSPNMTYSAPGWSLKQAAEAMTKGDFEHIVVVEPHGIAGIVSMRDVVRRWTEAD